MSKLFIIGNGFDINKDIMHFCMEKRIRRERKKLFTTSTELFEYKHKTTAINIEETHII